MNSWGRSHTSAVFRLWAAVSAKIVSTALTLALVITLLPIVTVKAYADDYPVTDLAGLQAALDVAVAGDEITVGGSGFTIDGYDITVPAGVTLTINAPMTMQNLNIENNGTIIINSAVTIPTNTVTISATGNLSCEPTADGVGYFVGNLPQGITYKVLASYHEKLDGSGAVIYQISQTNIIIHPSYTDVGFVVPLGFEFWFWLDDHQYTGSGQFHPGNSWVGNPFYPSSFTLYPYFVPRSSVTYTVTYDANGGEIDGDSVYEDPDKYTVGDTVSVIDEEPVWPGRTFMGWLYSGTLYEFGDDFVMPASNVTLVAQWAGISLTKSTSFDRQFRAGDEITWTIVVKNTGTTALEHVSLTDSIPGGTWVLPTGITDESDFTLDAGAELSFAYKTTATATDVMAGVITNTATATDGNVSATDAAEVPAFRYYPYTIQYFLNNELLGSPVVMPVVEEYTELTEADIPDSVLKLADYLLDSIETVPQTVVDDSVVISVYYYTQYTVTFVDWDGVVLGTQIVRYGESATAPADPAREGYNFTGWDTDFTNVTSSLTVTAMYTQIPIVVPPPILVIPVYTVTYDPGARGIFTVQTTSYLIFGAATPAAPATIGQAGWRFTGWSPTPTATVTGSVTYVAQWVQESYTVRFVDYNGTVLKTETVLYGGNATAPTSPSRANYNFTGWDRAYTNVTADITVTAQYAAVPPQPPTPSPDNTKIDDTTTPTTVGVAWALVNLILTVVGILLAFVLLIAFYIKRKNEDDSCKYHEKEKKRLWPRVFAAMLAIGAVVLFLVTENMKLPMTYTDRWTIWHAAILVAVIIFAVVASMRKKTDEGERQDPRQHVAV